MRLFCITILLLVDICLAWTPARGGVVSSRNHLALMRRSRRTSYGCLRSTNTVVEDDEAPAGIEGAQFFGGNKQKEEFYDPIAEAQAKVEIAKETYHRFADVAAFSDETAAALAQDLQMQIATNNNKKNKQDADVSFKFTYANNLQWETPFPTSKNANSNNNSSSNNNPIQELAQAATFYNHLDVAITSAQKSNIKAPNTYELRWEISVAWPTFWEPRVLLTGTSQLSLKDDDDDNVIIRQVDTLDDPDLTGSILRQILPRFWDVYHIGMTPSSEVSPLLKTPTAAGNSNNNNNNAKKGLLSSYSLYELPPRLYLQPTRLDTGNREDANAGMIPNHAFTSAIKTMGPNKERFVPASPVQVQLQPQPDGQPPLLEWKIPLTVEYQQANAEMTIPTHDDDNNNNNNADDTTTATTTTTTTIPPEANCEYVWNEARTVAILPYGGTPQDATIGQIRQSLYEQAVVNDGFQPKLDAAGRPQFFFWQSSVKACYTHNGGLGMAVYEWRPAFSKPNHVGIELESSTTSTAKNATVVAK